MQRPSEKRATKAPTVRCELVTDFKRLDQLSLDWQRLTSSDQHAEIFQSWQWSRASCKAYGSISSLCSPVVYEGGQVIGILPLARRGAVIEFLGLPDADYNDIICEEHSTSKVLAAALESILKLSPMWESCVFDNLSARSRIVRYWRTLSPHLRHHLQLTFQHPSPSIIFNDNKDEIISRLVKMRDLKRHYNKLCKRGHLTFRYLESRDEAREHLGHFFDQHIARFALNGLRSQFLEPDRCTFYEALIEELDPRTELRFAVLELDGHPVAYHLGFLQNGKFIHYKPTFDVNYWYCSPGDVLLLYLFKDAQETDIREFDFSVGDEAYKLRFTNHLQRNYTLHLDGHLVASCFKRLARRARQEIRQRPKLKDFLKAAAFRLKKAALQTARFVKSDDSLRCCCNALLMAFRNIIWTRDEVLLSCYSPETYIGPSCLGISPGSLSQLGHLSLQYPAFLSPAKLREYRARLQQGDQVFITDNRHDGVCILWTGWRNEVLIPQLGAGRALPLRARALLIEEGWSSPHFRSRDVRPEVLRALASQSKGQDTWIYCQHHEVALRRSIEDAGFQPRHRIVRTAFLHWFRRTWVSSLMESASAEQEAVHADSRMFSEAER